MAQTKEKRHSDDRGGDSGTERPTSAEAVAEKAWNAVKEEGDPYWGAIPNAELKSKLVFACQRVWVTGIALTNFEIKCKALITGVDVVLPEAVKEAREGEDAPNAVVAIEPLPPLPFTPGEAPPRPTPEPQPSEERSFAGNDGIMLTVDDFETSGAVSSVKIEGDAYPLPAYVVVPPNGIHTGTDGVLWQAGTNVLVTAQWVDLRVEAEEAKK